MTAREIQISETEGEGNHKEHKDRTEEFFVFYAFFAVKFFFGCGVAALCLCGEMGRQVFNSERMTL